MELLDETIDRELPDLARQGVRTRFFGRRDRVPEALRDKMAALEAETARNDRLHLWIAFDYGSRAELMSAVSAARSGAETITPGAIEANLYMPELPHVDVMVRTSGERRVSNFLLWQSAGSKIHFTDNAWPDFDAADLDAAIALVR